MEIFIPFNATMMHKIVTQRENVIRGHWFTCLFAKRPTTAVVMAISVVRFIVVAYATTK